MVIEDRLSCVLQLTEFPEPIGYLIHAQMNNIFYDLTWEVAATQKLVIPYTGIKPGKDLF